MLTKVMPAHHCLRIAVFASDGFDCQIFTDWRTLLRDMEHDDYQMLILDWTVANQAVKKFLAGQGEKWEPGFPSCFSPCKVRKSIWSEHLGAGADD